MGFRFRKSFKLMPGVRVNLSSKGLSTTVGVRGASVNISKRGTYLNTGIPGTGISSRTRIGSNTRNSTSNRHTAHAPKTPQPASTRWFSFGVALATFGVFSVISAYTDSTRSNPLSISDACGFILFWIAFGFIWWRIRRSRRRAKQARYEQYIAGQGAESQVLETHPTEEQQQRATQLSSEPATDLAALLMARPAVLPPSRQIYIGARGGKYYLDHMGKKVYIK